MDYQFSTHDLVCLGLCSTVGVWYIMKKHWLANDLLGMAFAIKMDHANGYLNICLLMFKSEAKCAKYKLEIIAHCADSTPQDASFSYICRGAPGSVDQEWDRLKQVRLTVSDEALRTILKKKNNHDQFKISFNII